MTTITIDRAVVEQALAALEAMNPYPASKEETRNAAITALREALNAPQPTVKEHLPVQPEPVAWINPDWPQNITHYAVNGFMPLYTAPPRREWIELSLDQISMAWDRAYRQPLSQAALNFARDLENTLKELNT